MTVSSIHELISQIFSLPPNFDFTPGLRPAYVPGWDSHGWLQLILALEAKFGQEMPIELFDRVGTVDEFCEVVVQFSIDNELNSDA